ncbi:hypothetical protein SDJN03_06603, partial [Cucurbita argyrosperma subsp. sororia]
MGNCQAVDAAALVIQHPSGRIERLYWPVVASEVMRTNPGHYVSLIIPLPQSEDDNPEPKTVRFTRVKLLRPNDTLALGHAYRLVTTQEVMKVLRAKKYAKSKKPLMESEEKRAAGGEVEETEKNQQAVKHERHRIRTPAANATAARSKAWRPSLQSISEAAA